MENGADINIQVQNGGNALHFCEDLIAIEFFLSRGANADQKTIHGYTALDHHVQEVVQTRYSFDREQSFSIAKILVTAMKNKFVKDEAEFAIYRYCNENSSLASHCNELSKMLVVKRKEIFRFRRDPLNSEDILRCQALSQSDCLDCSWRYYYSLERMARIPQPGR